MVSHNKERPSYSVTAEQYAGFYDRVQEEIDIEDLTRDFVVKKFKATPKYPKRQVLVEEFFIARSIALGNKYAKKFGIALNENRTAKIEKWKKQEVLVIRDKGRFLKWKRI